MSLKGNGSAVAPRESRSTGGGPPTSGELAGRARARRLVIRICLIIVILGLVVSGVTAFPLREELMLGRDLLNDTCR